MPKLLQYNGLEWVDIIPDDRKIIREVLKHIKLPHYDNSELREELLGEVRRHKLVGGGFSKIAMEGKLIDDETPTGTVNGTNKVFTLEHIPNPLASVKVFVNGMRMRITEDYTLSGKTITFVTAPPTTSIVLVDYRI